ncbi:Eukaryotic translation initiation factor NCBP [Cucumispora dikerogammari]|nr:Eukaryotic translation initiation factor NCBP [Cucumispora dikerogammari]
MRLRQPLIIRTSQRNPENKITPEEFTSTIHKLCTVYTLEELSYALHHIDFMNLSLNLTHEVSFFKETSEPLWEHPTNENGSQWSIKLEREVGERVFFKLLLRWVNHKFNTLNVNGIVISCRKFHVFITIWCSNNVVGEEKVFDVNREIIQSLKLGFKIKIFYKECKQSVADGSTISYKRKGKIDF